MYESKCAANIYAPFELEFCSVQLPEHWDGKAPITLFHEGGEESRPAVHPSVRRALERAAALMPLGLCTRLDVWLADLEETGLTICRVYWEG